jgi:transcriptional regulator of arginine metabolism
VNRHERHRAILRLIGEQPIATQAELAAALSAEGYAAVQTTVSRDVHELGLVKVRDESGRLVYAPPEEAGSARVRELERALRRAALSIESSGNLVVVVTPSGFASALAEELDRSRHPRILGTIAGDNTILIVAREGVSGAKLRDELRELLLEGAA